MTSRMSTYKYVFASKGLEFQGAVDGGAPILKEKTFVGLKADSLQLNSTRE